MAQLFSESIEHGGYAYRVSADLPLPDAADAFLAEGALPMAISAARRPLDADDWRTADGWREVTLDAELRPAEGVLVVAYEGTELARLSLDEPIPPRPDGDPDDAPDPEAFNPYPPDWDLGAIASGVARVVDWFPAVDPVLGCLLKGAVGETARRLAACWQEMGYLVERIQARTEAEARRKLADARHQRARATVRCVFENPWRLAVGVGKRMARCVLLG